MESPNVVQGSSSILSVYQKQSININAVIIENAAGGSSSGSDSIDVGINSLYKGLSVSAKQIVDKLNEMLKAKLPNGIQSLKPEDVTPDATASRIVQGATALFDIFKQQNPNLSDEELLKKFMDAIRSGVDQGYNDAFQTLDGLGAFQFDGVKEGVQKTKDLIEEKLKAFETAKRKELGLDPTDVTQTVSDSTKSEILSQAAGALNVVA